MTDLNHTPPLCALLMAGGSGLRLWPLSRPNRTKPLIRRLGNEGGASLLAETAARLPSVPPECLFVNVTRGLESEIKKHLPLVPRSNIIVAPEDRDTLPTLLFATSHIAQRYPDATLLLLASDNLIEGLPAFHETIHRAVRAAREGAHLVSIGIAPTAPSSRFGYMELGEPYAGIDETWYGVGYLEKPSLEVATRLVQGGMHDWNSGMFAWTIETFRRALEAYAPEEASVFRTLSETTNHDQRAKAFCTLRAAAVDTGLLEKIPREKGHARHVFVRGRFGWDDLGTIDALAEELPSDAEGNRRSGNTTVTTCKSGIFISEGPFALDVRGLENACVVVSDVGDTLIASRDALPEIRAMLAARREVLLSPGASGGSMPRAW